jgi:D-alanyl-lipoteichoic acid acyltransferase DltB (MBOAT superfamily)
VATGIWLILLGYVKKVVIADRLAAFVELGFANHGAPLYPNANSWFVLYAFAFQIYGDFAGYSDIARGLAKIMGFELPVNFRAPYLVTNPAEFWKHWHISLSTWLRDYLYIPLGGNRKGPARTWVNLMTTMLLGGLWHGAGIAYVLWGAYQGVLLAIHRAWSLGRKGTAETTTALGTWWPMAKRVVLVAVFFHIVCVGWLLFRAGALHGPDQFVSIRDHLAAMGNFRLTGGLSPFARPLLLLGGLALLLQWKCDQMDSFHSWRLPWQVVAVAGALTAIAAFGVFESAQFIYFQF